MKTLLLLFTFLSTSVLFAQGCADGEKIIDVKDMPVTAQEFIGNHFPDAVILRVIFDREPGDKNYDVYFADGGKIEFDKKGQWTDIECRTSGVPDSVIPTEILNYISENFPDRHVIGIDRDRNDYELELDNGMDLRFDLNFNFMGYDD